MGGLHIPKKETEFTEKQYDNKISKNYLFFQESSKISKSRIAEDREKNCAFYIDIFQKFSKQEICRNSIKINSKI